MGRSDRKRYYAGAAAFWLDAARRQSLRCQETLAWMGDAHFFVVAVYRLREVARQSWQRLGLEDLADALSRFDAAHPELINVRDYQEHILDPHETIGSCVHLHGGRLDRLNANFSTTTLIDPERLLEDAERLYDAIKTALDPLPEREERWVVRPPKPRGRSRFPRSERSGGNLGPQPL
jgi:hypothetical protein